MSWLDWVLLVLAVIVIVVTILQGGKTEGASSTIMGGANRSYVNVKERGPEKVLSRTTIVLAGLFFLLVILVRLYA